MADVRIERTRKKILNGLSMYLSTHGYTKTTIDKLADYIGVSKKTIYNHFDNRDELYIQAFIYDLEKILEKLKSVIEVGDKSFVQRLDSSMNLAYEEFSKRITILNLMDSKFIPLPVLEQIVPEIISNIKNLLLLLVDQGLEEGFFVPDIDRDIFSHLIYVLIMGSLSVREYNFKYTRKEYFYKSLGEATKGNLTDKGIMELERLLRTEPWSR